MTRKASVPVRIEYPVYAKASKQAVKQNRSVANYINTVLAAKLNVKVGDKENGE